MNGYQPRHAKPQPAQLPPILRGVADLITVIEDADAK